MKLLFFFLGIVCCLTVIHANAEVFPHSVVLLDGGIPASVVSKDTSAKRYWADVATDSIRVSRLDGTDVQPFLSGLATPYGIAYDNQKNKIGLFGAYAKIPILALMKTVSYTGRASRLATSTTARNETPYCLAAIVTNICKGAKFLVLCGLPDPGYAG